MKPHMARVFAVLGVMGLAICFSLSKGAASQFRILPEQPFPVRRGEPAYPIHAIAKKISGTVLVDVRVNSDGKVVETTALTGPEILRDPAMKAARSWVFKPMVPDIGVYVVRLIFIFHDQSFVPPAATPIYTSWYQMEVAYPGNRLSSE
jgi:TonB family protein